MRNIFKLGGTLFAITAIAAFLLSFVNGATADIIEAQKGSPVEIYQPVLPDATEFELVEGLALDDTNIVEIYEGTANGEVVGYGIETAPSGYGGPVTMYIGISTDGVITGFNVGDHGETPGLGDKITEDEFRQQFVDVSIDSS